MSWWRRSKDRPCGETQRSVLGLPLGNWPAQSNRRGAGFVGNPSDLAQSHQQIHLNMTSTQAPPTLAAGPRPRLSNRSPQRAAKTGMPGNAALRSFAAFFWQCGNSISSVALVFLLVGCGPRPQAPTVSPSAVEAMNRGVSLMGQYQYDEAVKAFEAVLQQAPDLNEARINLAIARFNRAQKETRDIETATALLDAVLQKDPNNLRALYFKGIVQQHLGQTEAAIPLLEKVVEQQPNDGAAWYLLGMCKQRLGRSAERELLRAIQLRPYLASAYYKLWQSFQAAGRTNEAAPYLEKFKQLRESPLNETIELPQYNQMGDLALALPLPAHSAPPIAKSALRADPVQTLLTTPDLVGLAPSDTTVAPPLTGMAIGDVDRDGIPDLLCPSRHPDGTGRLLLLRGNGQGGFADITATSGLENAPPASANAFGDFDNDEALDLAVAGPAGLRLFRGHGDGTFTDVTAANRLDASTAPTRCVLFLDADHDGDLDLYVGAQGGDQLWNNNADGSFTNIATSAGLSSDSTPTVAVLPGDLDGDRDLDLVLLREGQPARILINDLLGRYRSIDPDVPIRGDLGGVLQDFNGDAQLDLVTLGPAPAGLRLFLGDGQGHFRRDTSFDACARSAASWGALRGLRAADVDHDGDLDVALFSSDGHLLLNDGQGRFVLQPRVWSCPQGSTIAGAELADVTGDLVPDLLRIERDLTNAALTLTPLSLSPPQTAVGVAPTGMRGRDKRTRSPASGYGVVLTARAGLREQRIVYTGLAGGPCQSHLPAVLGLGGARHADYLHMMWSDGVMQVEMGLAAGQIHKVSELQRKISSCPVLFSWNGQRFECITDFAGVGGLGYFAAPGEYAPPRPLEHLKLEAHQLRPRDGRYELRITEPMEESAYVDRLELLAVDHPSNTQVFPDERLNVTGPPPTQELFVVDHPIFPLRATGPDGQDCTERLTRIDRLYAFEPTLDRRFFGFSRPHTIELDFGNQLAGLPSNQRVVLFLSGYLEYPYSQTVYAASQARIAWEPIRVDRQQPDGTWTTIVPDAGAFGGLARTMTVDLTGLVGGPQCRLRLSSNLELYYDQAFIAAVRSPKPDTVRTRRVPLIEATLRRVGFAREYSPDGRQPLLFDYELSDATAPFHVLKGAYTRYGPVEELLREFDDHYVLVGPGDEIALTYDAAAMGEPASGYTRSFILISHAWCKDMDLYTGTPQTLEPLPFAGMSRYPYPDTERYPDTEANRLFRATFNTRIVE